LLSSLSSAVVVVKRLCIDYSIDLTLEDYIPLILGIVPRSRIQPGAKVGVIEE